jgi:ankyrin repeat protein
VGAAAARAWARRRSRASFAVPAAAALAPRPALFASHAPHRAARASLPHAGGWTALHCAACGGHATLCDALLAFGCTAAPVSAEGDTPMHWAASTGQEEIMQMLLSAGAPPLPPNSVGVTPLHTAAARGHAALVAALLAAAGSGAADVADRGSSTPLHCASQNGHLEVARLLLQAGAAPNAVSNVRAAQMRMRMRARSALCLRSCVMQRTAFALCL